MGSGNVHSLHGLVPLVSTLVLSTLPFAAASTASTGFSSPPASVRPKFRYWLPDASVSEDVLRADIANISAVGAGGLEFVPFYLYGLVGSEYGPASWAEDGYGTPNYRRIFKTAAQASKDNGLVMDFAIGANQGQGAPSPPEAPGLAVELLLGNTAIAPGDTFSGPVPPPDDAVQQFLDGLGFQHPLEQWGAANLTGVIAAKVTKVTAPTGTGGLEGYLTHVELDLDSAVDLTLEATANGSLNFTPPEPNSTWRIFSFWEKYTNQKSCVGVAQADNFIANGSWTVDHFSTAGAKLTTGFMDQHILDDADVANLIREVGNYAWEDSMEMLATLWWTPGLLDRFEKARGYSLLKYLPVLFRPDNNWGDASPSYLEIFVSANSTAVNLDYRRTLNEGYHEYLTYIDEWAKQVGTLGYSAQPAYNLPLNMLSCVPLLTVPELESLGFDNNVDAYRQFTGAAHLSGRNIISSEAGAVNVAAYSQAVPEMLGIMTRSYAGGVNQLVVHGFPYSGPYPNTTWPGYTAFFYKFTEMWNQLQPAWQHLDDVFNFMGRTQWVLRQGTAKVDLALYLEKIPWTPTTSYSSDNLRSAGYTYEYLSSDNLQQSQATVTDGVLAADGPAYKALIFENQTTISVAGAENVLRLARAGLPIIIVGTPPEEADSAASGAQSKVTLLMQHILSSNNTHQVADAASVPQALSDLNLAPRAAIKCDGGQIFTVWRHDASAQADYVYLFNQGGQVKNCPLTFSVPKNAVPIIYDAWTGNQSALFTYERSSAGLITAEVSLATNQTTILAFKSASASDGVQDPLTATNGTTPIFKSGPSGKTIVGLFGPATIESASGNHWTFDVTVPAPSNLTSWNITIESWHSAANCSAVQNAITTTSFSNHQLVPWKLLGDGYEGVSGMGIYSAAFTVPSGVRQGKLGARLRLGPVDNTVRVYVDGRALPPVDITNAVVDVGELLVSGSRHVVRVEASSTLFNRVKADLDTVMVFGAPASYLQSQYVDDDAKDYGLLGPVVVEWYVEQELAEKGKC